MSAWAAWLPRAEPCVCWAAGLTCTSGPFCSPDLPEELKPLSPNKREAALCPLPRRAVCLTRSGVSQAAL